MNPVNERLCRSDCYALFRINIINNYIPVYILKSAGILVTKESSHSHVLVKVEAVDPGPVHMIVFYRLDKKVCMNSSIQY